VSRGIDFEKIELLLYLRLKCLNSTTYISYSNVLYGYIAHVQPELENNSVVTQNAASFLLLTLGLGLGFLVDENKNFVVRWWA
jgi:hypothetical protein